MKFKVKYEKCLVWLYLRKYVYFAVYLFLVLFIAYIYFFTYYEFTDTHLVNALGFIKIKFKYEKIKEIKEENGKVNIKFNHFTLTMYPANEKLFLSELKARMKHRH